MIDPLNHNGRPYQFSHGLKRSVGRDLISTVKNNRLDALQQEFTSAVECVTPNKITAGGVMRLSIP